VPKVVTLFGPNASGKSTILRALTFIAWFARDSLSQPPEARLPFERFNDEGSAQRPTFLRLHFAGLSDPSAATTLNADYSVYIYELLLGNSEEGKNWVISESLRRQPGGQGRSHKVFERIDDGTVSTDATFRLGAFSGVTVRKNASAISTLAQLGHLPSLKFREAAQTVLSNILLERYSLTEEAIAGMYLRDPKLVESLNREIDRIDLGVRDVQVASVGGSAELQFRHEGLQRPMRLMSESHGTRAVLHYFPMINIAFQTGGIAVIDELDASIHPRVVAEMFRWFHDPIRNPQNAQLWITCHNASLLDELEKEEVFICEKNKKGQSRIYGLKDVKAVRRDHNLYRKYMSGVYGGVPLIG
jgi:hypothetical protein